MEAISVFDIFKVGVGPSSSHTMGPWRAAQRFLEVCRGRHLAGRIARVTVDLYGSLAKTGVGHGTDLAVILGLAGDDPVTTATERLKPHLEEIRRERRIALDGLGTVEFQPEDVRFHKAVTLPFHPNGLTFTAVGEDGPLVAETYYSIGGGFIVQEEVAGAGNVALGLPFPIETAAELLEYCRDQGATIPEIVRRNERTWRSDDRIDGDLAGIWGVMSDCIYRGCHTEGLLPGPLGVTRRAAAVSRRRLGERRYETPEAWRVAIRGAAANFRETLSWVSAFALAVNEENAAFGRVVTAPTNGAAGVVPAVLMYHLSFGTTRPSDVSDFLLTAGEVGSLFKKGATLSAAMGGCQAEIGVSSAMAAAGLAQVNGADPARVLMAAEIAMEHHLGLTCDPIGGLVQIPCIERNSMGAIKAITAVQIALESDPGNAKVSLDAVIRSMWATALDMNSKYKETSEGGLAIQIPVNLSEC